MTNTLKIYGYRCPQDDDVMPTDLAQECQNDEGFAYTDPLVRLKDVRELVQKGGSRVAAGWQPSPALGIGAGKPYLLKLYYREHPVVGVRPYPEAGYCWVETNAGAEVHALTDVERWTELPENPTP